MDTKAFHKLSYGLYIIASEHQGEKSGYIGNTVFQVTSEPSRVAISCHKDNYTMGIIRKSQMFSVSVLKQDLDISVIRNFGYQSGKDMDKFKNIQYRKCTLGVPVVTEASVAWFECSVVQETDAGSHILFIGEIKDAGLLSDEPVLTYTYYRETYKMMAPRNAPTYLKDKTPEDTKTQEPPESGSPGPEKKKSSEKKRKKPSYACSVCGYIYHPEEGDAASGIPPGTAFADLPEDYRCPVCNAEKELFKPVS
jgi:flavin reductase (DIM6/NTAB) family NADH-FMN oxidoreductase RutF/rubredoxin